MAVYQISRIQHRRGSSGDLPDALADGEIGMTTDTGEVFIGASSHPGVSGRNSYPYKNIKLITELDIQRSITGDVYYHGPMIHVTTESTGSLVSCVPLFKHGSVSFANYDFSLQNSDGTVKLVGMMTVCVHPTEPTLSTINIVSNSICLLGWPDMANVPSSSSGHFSINRVDDTGSDSGTTWLAFKNNFGFAMTLSVSGREWTVVQDSMTPIPTILL